jgi:hypothetical protein
MSYPTDLDTFNGTTAQGTSTLSSPDHALDHRTLGSAVGTLEAKVGLSAGSPTLNRILVGSGNGTSGWGTSVNNLGLGTATLGTSTFIGGTIGTAVIGTSTIQGGTANNQVIGTPSVTGGTQAGVLINTSTFNTGTIGTPTIAGGTVAISGTTVPLSFGAGIVPTVVTLTDSPSGTIALNAQAAQLFHMVLGTTAGNRTFGTPSNATEGQAISFRIKQNSNNTGTIVWPAIYRFNEGGTPTLGTTSSYNYFGWRYNSIDTKWDFQGNSRGVV